MFPALGHPASVPWHHGVILKAGPALTSGLDGSAALDRCGTKTAQQNAASSAVQTARDLIVLDKEAADQYNEPQASAKVAQVDAGSYGTRHDAASGNDAQEG